MRKPPEPRPGPASKYAQGDVLAPPREADGYRRRELMLLMSDLGLGQQQLADVLTEETGDPISLRTVQRWLAEPGRGYARDCPGWPIAILRYRASRERIPTRDASTVRTGDKVG